jgi:hypothetical protein
MLEAGALSFPGKQKINTARQIGKGSRRLFSFKELQEGSQA